jgi:hypothetical protein
MSVVEKRKPLKVIAIIAVLAALMSVSVLAYAQENDQPEAQTDADAFFQRNIASLEQRQMARERDLTQFDDPEVRERWCQDDWIILGGESLGHIVVNCGIPLANILAENPQIDNPDLVFVGEIVRLPDEIRPVDETHSRLTASQQEYLLALTPQEGEIIPGTGIEVGQVNLEERRFASAEQRQFAEQRDLSQFDDPEVRDRWCQDDWIVRSGESLAHIVVFCGIPIDVLLAHNPQIGHGDLVFAGEIITMPPDPEAEIQPELTQEQLEYLEENFTLDPSELESPVDDDEGENDDEDENGEDDDDDEGEGDG